MRKEIPVLGLIIAIIIAILIAVNIPKKDDITHETWLYFNSTGALDQFPIFQLDAGTTTQDRRISRLIVHIFPAPAKDAWVNTSISDGTNLMWVNITNVNTYGYTTTGAFDLDVSAETLLIAQTRQAMTETTYANVIVQWNFKENE